ncbi:LAFE_0G00408g1_1 [Lachancea fermentati]|uniref:LAFE_0G00408g1_1 n=1 Tax=Lachancea fermentati TaxID=4955 RepID=A0A1G4MGF3_LACFM|nr:LAFE_0G00408g1_1 [Lachancea fermentati]
MARQKLESNRKSIRPTKITKSRGAIKKSEKIKARLKSEQLNKQSLVISDLKLVANNKGLDNKLASLNVKRLAKDHERDKQSQRAMEERKLATDNDMVKQLSAISDFTL